MSDWNLLQADRNMINGIKDFLNEKNYPSQQVNDLELKPGLTLQETYETVSEYINSWDDLEENNRNMDSFSSKFKTYEEELLKLLQTPVESLKVNFGEHPSVNPIKLLKNNDINNLGDLINKTPSELILETGLSENSILSVISKVQEKGIDYGNDFIRDKEVTAVQDYWAKVTEFLDDNFLDPFELYQLKQLQEELGLSDFQASEIKKDVINITYAPETKEQFGQAKLLDIEDAYLLCDYYNENKFEIEKANTVGNKPVNVTNKMSEDLAKAILETLQYADYDIYSDFDTGRFWLVDTQDHWNDWTFDNEPKDINYLIGKAQDISHEWNRDETTVTENRYVELIDGLFTDQIYIPVDINYKYNIPRKFLGTYNEIGDSPQQVCLNAITDVFGTPSELIENNSKGFSQDLTLRHLLICSNDSNYGNINFKEIENVIQNLAGKNINEAMGTKQEILFSDLHAFIPENFHTERNHLVKINEWTIDKFKDTPEEYVNGLNLELVKFAGSSIAREAQAFIQEKNEFLEILSKEPLLNEYVQSKWKPVKGQDILVLERDELYEREIQELAKDFTKLGNESEKKIQIEAVFVPRMNSVREAAKVKEQYILTKYKKNDTEHYAVYLQKRSQDGNSYEIVSENDNRNEAIKIVSEKLNPEKSATFGIFNSHNLNVLPFLYGMENERARKIEDAIGQAYLENAKRIAENNPSMAIEAVKNFSFAKFNRFETEILNKYLNKKGIKNSEELTAFLKKEIKPEHEIKRTKKRSMDIEHTR